jgi:hypothetical protein
MYSARYSTGGGQSVLRNLSAGNATTANADLIFSEGGLSANIPTLLYISPTNVVTKVPATDASYTASITVSSGMFGGFFPHTNGTRPAYRGVIYQKGDFAGGHGYFLSTGGTGHVSLLPK